MWRGECGETQRKGRQGVKEGEIHREGLDDGIGNEEKGGDGGIQGRRQGGRGGGREGKGVAITIISPALPFH